MTISDSVPLCDSNQRTDPCNRRSMHSPRWPAVTRRLRDHGPGRAGTLHFQMRSRSVAGRCFELLGVAALRQHRPLCGEESAIERGRSHIRARSAWRALLRNRPRKDYAGLVSHAAHREAGRRGTSVPIQIAVRCVIGVLVAPVVIAATKPEASAAMKVIAAEVAAHLGVLTRKAATESRARGVGGFFKTVTGRTRTLYEQDTNAWNARRSPKNARRSGRAY